MNDKKHMALDIETELIGAGRLAPRIACVSISYGKEPSLHSPTEAVEILTAWLSQEHGWLVGHNIAFDLFALCRHSPKLAPLVWRCYEDGLVWDCGLHERLYTLGMGWSIHPAIGRPIVTGGVSLADMARGLVGIEYGDLKTGASAPRMHYGDLIGVEIDDFPQSAVDYALLDARVTFSVFQYQLDRCFETTWSKTEHKAGSEFFELPSQTLQTRAAWALHHLAAWGLRSSPERVEQWAEELTTKRSSFKEGLTTAGFLKESDGKRDMSIIRRSVELAYGAKAPRTEKGQIQTSNEVLRESGDPLLYKLAEYMDLEKLKTTFEPTLKDAAGGVLSPRWNTLVRSGRCSCTKPNLQQLPKKGGVREAFTPRENHLYVGADYSTAELVALAHVCEEWGIKSEMGAALRAGYDLHLALAAEMLNITYEEAQNRHKSEDAEIGKMRQLAKVPNFGLSGGLGAEGLKGFAKSSYNIELSLDECKKLRASWFKRWPEMSAYFRRIEAAEQKGHIVQSYSHRRRGGIGYTDGANTMFQGLIADGAKEALFDVVRACWMEPQSPLFGSRPVLFIHDEIILETPKEAAAAAGDELALLMQRAMKRCIPNLPMGVDPWVSSVWSKSNKERRDAKGFLIPCA